MLSLLSSLYMIGRRFFFCMICMARILHSRQVVSIDTTPLITNSFPLSRIEEAYKMFENKEDSVIKIAIDNRYQHMKSFGSKPWMLPQPVLIIGTYNEDATPNAENDPEKMKKTGWTALPSENVNEPIFTDIVADVINILVDESCITEDGQPDIHKMELISYEPVHHEYIALGETVGKAFADGKKLK